MADATMLMVRLDMTDILGQVGKESPSGLVAGETYNPCYDSYLNAPLPLKRNITRMSKRRRTTLLASTLCAAVACGSILIPTATASSDEYWQKRDERNEQMDQWEQELKERRETMRSGSSSSGSSESSSSSSSSESSKPSSDDGEDSKDDEKPDKDKDDDQSGDEKLDWDALEKTIDDLVGDSDAQIGVAVAPATKGAGISVAEAGETMYSASTIKIPVALAVQKNLKPDDTAEITEIAGGTGSVQPGTHKVSDLLEAMITESDNSATNALIDKLGGFEKVNEIAKKAGGGDDVKLDNKMMSESKTSTISANAMTKILQRLWSDSKDKSDDDKVLDKDKAGEIIGYMKDQQYREKLPSKIDDDKAVANKTGENDTISHDVGYITNSKKSVAIAVTGDGNPEEVNALIGDIGKAVYDWLGE